MKKQIVIMITVAIISACNTKTDNDMSTTEIFPKGEPLSNEWFTGNAFIFPLVAKDKNNDFSAGNVTFEQGARTVWHIHPKGQVLIVIE